MMLFTGVALPYLEAGQLVATQGFVETSPERLKSIEAGNNDSLTTIGEVVMFFTNTDTTTAQLDAAPLLEQDPGESDISHVALLANRCAILCLCPPMGSL